MDREMKALEKSICELTDAVKQLTASMHVSKPSTNHFPANKFRLIEGPKELCRDENCGVINSDSITCDHTLARYRSEYNCG